MTESWPILLLLLINVNVDFLVRAILLIFQFFSPDVVVLVTYNKVTFLIRLN